MVVSPEHAIVKEWLEKGILKNADAVKAYQAEAARKSDFCLLYTSYEQPPRLTRAAAARRLFIWP